MATSTKYKDFALTEEEILGLPTAQVPTVVQEYSKQIVWVDGKPTVQGIPAPFGQKNTSENLKALMKETLNLPYSGRNPAYQGLTKGEAIILSMLDDAAAGDKDARQELLDRLMGKPKQTVESLKIEGSLEEFLEAIDERENGQQPQLRDDVLDI